MEKEPIASKICINPFVSVDSKFKRDSELYYKMRLKSFDFTDNLDDAIRLINDYIQAATNGRIRDMVDANDVDSDTEFFVPSAFFMDVKFDQPFHKGRTVTKPFYTENGVVKQVNMMNAALYDRNVRLITTWKKTRRWSQGQSFEQEKDPYLVKGIILLSVMPAPQNSYGLPTDAVSDEASGIAAVEM
ncbi:hypothetical protein QR680_004293 [Steinernema hermaphroditum]|uniref:Serpin domain-containing protein n=1 Tax=Steinernema hermaphroditum TaxID=289476 RepID=A0AA39HQI6_9BILA|nr:hypothetical protein QR680_004293 [Steinernema hermaphroditum]